MSYLGRQNYKWKGHLNWIRSWCRKAKQDNVVGCLDWLVRKFSIAKNHNQTTLAEEGSDGPWRRRAAPAAATGGAPGVRGVAPVAGPGGRGGLHGVGVGRPRDAPPEASPLLHPGAGRGADRSRGAFRIVCRVSSPKISHRRRMWPNLRCFRSSTKPRWPLSHWVSGREPSPPPVGSAPPAPAAISSLQWESMKR